MTYGVRGDVDIESDGIRLSLSGWCDKKTLVRGRTQAMHHGAQGKGRFEGFRDDHLPAD